MFTNILLLTSIIVCILTLVNCDRNNVVCNRAVPYDYLTLALQWPSGVCIGRKDGCIKTNDTFLIHGLWPTYKNGSWPDNCCYQRQFDDKNVRDVESRLKEVWKTLFTTGSDKSFWTHEWKKHGTCASFFDPFKGQSNYFVETLRLYDQADIRKWLSDKNIKAQPIESNSGSYSQSQYHSAIESHTGKKIRLECRRVPRKFSSQPVLSGIHLCYDPRDLKYIDCPIQDDRDCGSNIRFLGAK